MSVPTFQEWFLPLLRYISDGDIHKMSDVFEGLADDLNLTPEDRAEVLPSGKQFTYRNRIGWARTYLKKAGLVQSPKRAHVQITAQGQELLANPPPTLNVSFLKGYSEAFVEFHTSSGDADTQESIDAPASEDGTTPEEELVRLHRGIEQQLRDELLDLIKVSPPEFFERLVLDLLLRMGYGGAREDAGRTVGKITDADGGIDGVINEDPLGLDIVCIQAKRWEASVGRPIVQAFAGSLEGYRAKKGVLITTSSFTKGADAYVRQIEKRIILIDGERLAALMVQYDLGVSTMSTLALKRIDSDYFEDD